MPNRRENWLGRYLSVQLASDRAVNRALREAANSAEAELLRLASREGIGAEVRRSQLATTRQALRRIISVLYGNLIDEIRSGQKSAAQAAVEAALADETRIMARLFPNSAERKAFQLSLVQSAERNIQALVTRVSKTQQPLSARIYRSKLLADGSVDKILNNGIARGESVGNLSKELRSSISPNAPGGVAYAAKRLARTEINNAYHAQSVLQNEEKPWVESVQWNLSKTHPHGSEGKIEVCERYANTKQFHKDSVPDKPHPNCLCYVTPVLISYEQFEKNLLAGVYRGWMQDNEAA